MKKNSILVLGLLLLTAMVFTACDKVDPPYTTIGGNIITGDTVRKVLIEDYTGHKCINCPAAHQTIQDLQGVYGDRIVVMAIHAGFFAQPHAAPYDYDFRTSVGTELATAFGAVNAGLPKGVIQRKEVNGAYILDMGAFGEQVSLVLDSMPTKPDIYIEMVGAYTSSDSSLAVDVKLTALSAMPAGKYNLSVFVTESEIIEAQESRDNSGVVTTIADYEHNHVFRGAMNGTWGFEFTNGAISSGQVFTKAYSGVKIGKDWKPAHLHLVALVYHADGPNENQVIQVEQIDL